MQLYFIYLLSCPLSGTRDGSLTAIITTTSIVLSCEYQDDILPCCIYQSQFLIQHECTEPERGWILSVPINSEWRYAGRGGGGAAL